MSYGTSWLLYSAVVYPDKTLAVENSNDTRYRNIALQIAKEVYKNDEFIEDVGGVSVRVLYDTFIFVCVFKKSADPQKALKYLYDVKNAFAFKYCGGVLSKANKNDLQEKVQDFQAELAKAGKTYETGINMDLTHQANEKIQEVAGVLHEAIKKQYKSQEGTEKLLDDSKNIFAMAKTMERTANKLKPSCCQRFWNFSKPCVLLFVFIISVFVVYGIVSLTMCGDITLFVDC